MLGTFAAVAPIVFARVFVVGNYQIPSDSMLPTLRRGDRVWGEKISARRGAVAAGDIVTGPRTVVEAVAFTKKVLPRMEEYLRAAEQN